MLIGKLFFVLIYATFLYFLRNVTLVFQYDLGLVLCTIISKTKIIWKGEFYQNLIYLLFIFTCIVVFSSHQTI